MTADRSPAPSAPCRIGVVLPPIEPYSPAGGAIATVTRHAAREWTAAGHEVTVFAPPTEPGGPDPYAVGVAIPVAAGGTVRLRRLATRAGRLAGLGRADWEEAGAYTRALRAALDRAGGFDLLVVHNDLQLLPLLASWRPGARLALWLHNAVETAARRPAELLGSADAVVAVSGYIAGWTERRYGLDPGTVRVVPNGVDLDRFHPRPDFERPRVPVRVVCHGRIDPNKGFHLTVEAVRLLVEAGRPVTVTVAGAPQAFGIPPADAREYHRRLLEALEGVGSYVGRVSPDDVPELLRAHDVACVPSLSEEPFSLSAVEAMASGCALVASRRGGLAEVCGDGGTLVEPDSAADLVAALDPLVADASRLAGAKRAARRRAETFPWSVTAAGVLAAAGIGSPPAPGDGAPSGDRVPE